MKRKTVSEKRIEIRGMRGGVLGRSSRPLEKWGAVSKTIVFGPYGPQFGLKMGGAGGGRGSPGSATVINIAIACFELGLFLFRF